MEADRELAMTSPQHFHHDGKNCLSTQMFPIQSSWEAEWGLWRGWG